MYLGLWGKSHPYHPLWCHLVDVGCVATILWREILSDTFRRQLSDRFGLSLEQTENLVLWLAALHDIGKASPGFQALDGELSRSVREAGLFVGGDYQAHGLVTAHVLRRMLKHQWGRSLVTMAAVASGGHHGTLFSRLPDISWPVGISIEDEERWTSAQDLLAECVEGALALHLPKKPTAPETQCAVAFLQIAGLISFADWIGSASEHFHGGTPPTDPREYVEHASKQARAALRAFGWIPHPVPRTGLDYKVLFPFVGDEPRPLQVEVARILREAPDTRFIVVEAPMGEGKTEAALYAARHWIGHFQQSGLYLALPTQATSNAMYARVLDWIRHLDLQMAPDTLLIHSGLVKPEEFERILNATRNSQLFDGSESGLESFPARVHEWFLQAKRGLLAPFGIGTIDQALMAVLFCRHHFVRLQALAGKTIIFDEIHSYDAYTGTLLDRLLEYLGALGCTVVLLSATLPEARRLELIKSFTGSDPDPAAVGKYPRVTYADSAGQVRCVAGIETKAGNKAVKIDWLPNGLEECIQGVLGKLGDFGCGAFIFNSVADVQRAYRFAIEHLPSGWSKEDIFILHSRYTAGERQEKEKRLLQAFGRDAGENRPRRAVVFASQVLEQSLDLDFDLMASELAPIDLILQRLGRLHRHAGRNRSRHAHPVLYLRSPEDGAVPNYGRSVYSKAILLESHAVLLRYETKPLIVPDHMDGLIEAVYTRQGEDDLPDKWREAHKTAREKLQDAIEKHTKQAEERNLQCVAQAQENWRIPANITDDEDDIALHRDARPVTRLGEDSIRALCLFAAGKNRLTLDREGKRLVSPDTHLRDLLENVGTVSLPQVGKDSFEEIRSRSALDKPPWMMKKGVLRHLPLLVFDGEGICPLVTRRIHWDQEVGLEFIK